MKKHKQIVMKFFDLVQDEFVPCERCIIKQHKPFRRAVDVHHADPRGMGGDQTGEKDCIENLGMLCRECHDIVEADPEENDFLKEWLVMLDERKECVRLIMNGYET